MEKHVGPPLLSPPSYEQFHTIGYYLDESEVRTTLVAKLSALGHNPTFLNKPYGIYHLEVLRRLAQKHPKITSLKPEQFVERFFALAYELVYTKPAPLTPTEEQKDQTLYDLRRYLKEIVFKRQHELEACRLYE